MKWNTKNGNVRIFKLESTAIQCERGERGAEDYTGFVIYFDTAQECNQTYSRIASADFPYPYARKIFDTKRSEQEPKP